MSALRHFTEDRTGWPMRLWLTPAREPYAAGMYFPPGDGDAEGPPGFLTQLRRLRTVYEAQVG